MVMAALSFESFRLNVIPQQDSRQWNEAFREKRSMSLLNGAIRASSLYELQADDGKRLSARSKG